MSNAMTRNSQQTEAGWNSESDYEFGSQMTPHSEAERRDINPEDNHTMDVADDPEKGANSRLF
jgi:hypothetical protein